MKKQAQVTSEDDSDDEIALLTRRFSKFLKFNKQSKLEVLLGIKSSIRRKRTTSIPRVFPMQCRKEAS